MQKLISALTQRASDPALFLWGVGGIIGALGFVIGGAIMQEWWLVEVAAFPAALGVFLMFWGWFIEPPKGGLFG